MSFGVDVNVLLYASDATCPEYEVAGGFMRRLAAGPELCCIAWPTVMSYLRMATHPAIFAKPLAHDDAARNIESLLALPHVRAIGEDEGFWSRYTALAADVPLRGNLVPDAHVAALLLQHGVKTIYTRDRDFRKFSGLKVIDPFA